MMGHRKPGRDRQTINKTTYGCRSTCGMTCIHLVAGGLQICEVPGSTEESVRADNVRVTWTTHKLDGDWTVVEKVDSCRGR